VVQHGPVRKSSETGRSPPSAQGAAALEWIFSWQRKSKLILATGATGYVGSTVVRRLLPHGLEVAAMVRDAGAAQASDCHLKVTLCERRIRAASTPSPPGDQLQPGRQMEAAHQQVHRDHSAKR
jgi:NAD(P)-dependent dehydrogenase (short-subunit alcohol dehydrogenase family)